MREINTVCVYCASRNDLHQKYFDLAAELGTLLGKQGMHVINGGGGGLMREVSRSVLQAGGTVTGIMPKFMTDNKWNYPELTSLITVENMHERKQKMADMADAVIALPGGCGTLEELLEIITWKQLGHFSKPIVILNFEGYYNPLLQMFETAISNGFMHHRHKNMWAVASSAQQANELIHNMPAWDNTISKFIESTHK